MLKNLPKPLKGLLNSIFLTLGTIFWCTPMYVFMALKFFSRSQNFTKWLNSILVKIGNNWIATNNLWMDLTFDTKWQIPDLNYLSLDESYFIVCNHQSWTDIVILQRLFLLKAPFIRFFIKKELIWLPFLGVGWWAYDFPMMARHSKAQLSKNPSLKGKDLETTRKACEKFKNYPVTILNFLEGTRFTPAKNAKQSAKYSNLLNPKLGGFSHAIYAMDRKISYILDVTIIYPEGIPGFWQFLCGEVGEIIVDVQQREIPEQFITWKDLDNPSMRQQFENWVNTLWERKDSLINQKAQPLSPD